MPDNLLSKLNQRGRGRCYGAMSLCRSRPEGSARGRAELRPQGKRGRAFTGAQVPKMFDE